MYFNLAWGSILWGVGGEHLLNWRPTDTSDMVSRDLFKAPFGMA